MKKYGFNNVIFFTKLIKFICSNLIPKNLLIKNKKITKNRIVTIELEISIKPIDFNFNDVLFSKNLGILKYAGLNKQ
jgi:hypothetical protein